MPEPTLELQLKWCMRDLENAYRAGNPNAIDDLLDEEDRLRDLLGLTRRR